MFFLFQISGGTNCGESFKGRRILGIAFESLLRITALRINATQCRTLGGGFNVFLFSPEFGEDSHFD